MTRTAHFLVNTLALKRGGLVKAVRERANALAADASMSNVKIAVLAGQPRLQLDVDELKKDGHLHQDVTAYSILYSLDSSSVDKRSPFEIEKGSGITVFPTGTSGREFRHFRDGIYEKYVRLDPVGRIEVVEYFNEARFRYQRDEMDETGSVARTLTYQPGSASPTVQRFFGKDTACFLTIWQTPGNPNWGVSFVHGENPRSFATMGALYKFAFERVLKDEAAPAIVSEFRENLPNLPRENVDDIVSSLRHPNLLKVMTAHSNHLQPPYVSGSATSVNWTRAGKNLDAWDRLVVLTSAQKSDLSSQFGHGDIMKVIGQVAPEASAESAIVDPYRIVLVARIHAKKRLDEAMRVFAHVAAAEPRARMEVFGFGYKDAEEDSLADLINELGIKDSVKFMPFTNNPAEIYGSALVTLLTSASEGFPLILLESMGHGVPVAAYDANYGPRDVINNGQNGFLLPFGANEAMAEKILELMKNPAQRDAMKSVCRETLEKFSKSHFVENWVEVFSAEPRPNRVVGNTIGPVVSEVKEVAPGELEFLSNGPLSAELGLILVNREGVDVASAETINAGAWILSVEESRPGTILDVFATTNDGSLRKRVEFGRMEAKAVGGWRIYETLHGCLSLKRM
jgi:poly(glycerol-phosphate) alpha-glucosyltransferase